jgi:hypothetical protein
MREHALNLLADAPKSDVATTRRAIDLFEAVAETGDVDAMLFAVAAHGRIGQMEQSRKWAVRARETGNLRAIEKLDKIGL